MEATIGVGDTVLVFDATDRFKFESTVVDIVNRSGVNWYEVQIPGLDPWTNTPRHADDTMDCVAKSDQPSGGSTYVVKK